MSVFWHLFTKKVTIEAGVNDVIAYTDSGGDDTITLDAGDYYVLGDESADDLLGEIESKLDADSPDSYSLTVKWYIGERSGNHGVSITITSSSSSFKLRFGNASTTFDPTLIGWPASDTSAAAAQSNPDDPFGCWMADQPPASAEKSISRLGSHSRTIGKTHFGFNRGGPYADRRYRFELIRGERVFEELIDGGVEGMTFEKFMEECGADGPFRIYKAPEGSAVGTECWVSADAGGSQDSLTQLQSNDFALGPLLFDAPFEPNRDTQGLEVYGWSFKALESA